MDRKYEKQKSRMWSEGKLEICKRKVEALKK